jgi:hypothetical protein
MQVWAMDGRRQNAWFFSLVLRVQSGKAELAFFKRMLGIHIARPVARVVCITVER